MVKSDFPIFKTLVNGYPLRYLDTASTSQKPQMVIDAIADFYATHNANVGRAVYPLAEEATRAYEDARATVAQFIGADKSEIIFTSGCTEGINFIASAWATYVLRPGDEIVLTELEHHANIVPWQQVVERTGAVLKYIPITSDGLLDLSHLDSIITQATKLVSCTLISNALGTRVDVALLIARARTVGAKVLLDAAQAVVHEPIDVRILDCDFLVFSGHKMLGPTGIGVLYIKRAVQEEVKPYQLGGGMVLSVNFFDTTYQKGVSRFEAGTPPIAQAVGLAAAVNYLQALDRHALKKHTTDLCRRAIEDLQKFPGITVLGPMSQLKKNGHLVSFTAQGIHSHDMAAFLGNRGICVRAGTHCAQPLFSKLGLPQGSVRVSFCGYNTPEDVEFLLEGVSKALQSFSGSAMAFDK